MLRNKSTATVALSGCLFALFLLPASLMAADYQVEFNPADYLITGDSTGVQVVSGLWNDPAIALSDDEYEVDENTELLLSFNEDPVQEIMDNGQNYGVQSSGVRIQSYESYRGGASAMFMPGEGLDLVAGQGSMFSPGSIWSDFTIEFWMYPAEFGAGEQLFYWRGTSWIENQPILQEISVRAEQGRLVWDFQDVFISLSPDEEGYPRLQSNSVTLESRSEIVPRTWSHHMLRYDSENGVLEYLINGVSEAVAYLTADGKPGGAPLFPYIGEESENRVRIAPDFHGFLDEFRIERAWVDRPKLDVAENSPGVAIVGPIDLGTDGTRLTGFDAQYRTPGHTDIRYSIMQRDAYNPLLPSDINNDSAWNFVKPGTRSDKINPGGYGRYVYLRLEFFPDGSKSNIPLLQNVSLSYQLDPAPPAPSVFTAVAGDASVQLSWEDVIGSDVQGYLLYYGDSPGEYFGEDANAGPSPIDLGKVNSYQLDGLINGKMYYFRLASYNSYNSPERGLYRDRNLSREVFARPSRIQE